MEKPDNQASAVAYQTVNGVVQTLMKPTRDSWGYNAETNEVTVFLTSDQWQIEGNPQATIYYAIGSGAYQATTEAYVEMVLTVGTIIKYYSHADGFNDSPVTSIYRWPPTVWNGRKESISGNLLLPMALLSL